MNNLPNQLPWVDHPFFISRQMPVSPAVSRIEPGADLPAVSGRVLVVDDGPANVALLQQLLTREGHSVLTASDGLEALAIVERERPDLVLTDVQMPGRDGHELCRAIKAHPATRLTPVVLITSLQGREERLKGINAGADDFVVKPVDGHELRARVRSLLRLKRYTDELDSAEAVIMSLALTVEARDPNTEGHCQRLSRLAAAVGTRIGLGADDIAALSRGGTLHDIGKIGVPDAILLKPAPLTAEEFEQMKLHTVIGDRICSELRLLRRVRPIVRHHHERLDGSGYPDGLRGSDVPLLAQIIGVVDVFDALTTARPYKPALTLDQAFEELHREARKGWRDAALVDELIQFCTEDTRDVG
jgi:putative two-component system response regulator